MKRKIRTASAFILMATIGWACDERPDGPSPVAAQAEALSHVADAARCESSRFELVVLETPPRGTGAAAFSLNAHGDVAGVVDYRNGAHRAALWQDGKLVEPRADFEVSSLESPRGLAFDLNDTREVAGWNYRRTPQNGAVPSAYLWDDQGGMTKIEESVSSRAYALNNNGLVAGDIDLELFVWTAEAGQTLLGVTVGPGYESAGRVLSTSDAGSVVGAHWSNNRRTPFEWTSGGGIRNLTVGDADEGEAHDVNDAGIIVGRLWQTGDAPRAVMWDADGNIVELGAPLEGTLAGHARAINAHGEIVGYDDAAMDRSDAAAWIHRAGEKRPLTPMVENASGWHLDTALDINDAGQIVGYGRVDGSEVPQPFLLTPVCN